MFWILLSFFERPQHVYNCTLALQKITSNFGLKAILMYTQVLIYTHLHLCTTSTLMNDLDRCQPARIGARHCPTPSRNPGPDSDADESRRDESRQSRTVTVVTWMTHSSHEPNVDESRQKHAGYQCLCCN